MPYTTTEKKTTCGALVIIEPIFNIKIFFGSSGQDKKNTQHFLKNISTKFHVKFHI